MPSKKRKSSSKKGKHVGEDIYDLEEFKPSVWKMPSMVSAIPVISVNEHEVRLDDQGTEIDFDSSAISYSDSKSSLFTDRTQSTTVNNEGISSSSDETINTRIIREQQSEERKTGIHHHLRLWRRKLLVLIWLNFLVRYRKTFTTVVEVIVPIIILASLVFGMISNGSAKGPGGTQDLDNRWRDQVNSNDENTPFNPFNIMSQTVLKDYVCSNDFLCNHTTSPRDRHYYFVYSPNNTFVNNLMKDVVKKLGFSTHPNKHSKLIGVKTPKEVIEACIAHYNSNDKVSRFPTGIIFSFGDYSENDNLQINYGSNGEIPKRLKYSIRTYDDELANTAELYPFSDRTSLQKNRHDVSPYVFCGFTGLQIGIDLAYIEQIVNFMDNQRVSMTSTGENILDLFLHYKNSINVRMFKFPLFLDEESRRRSWSVITMAFILSYIPSNFCVVQEMCYEAEVGTTELLKFHGLTPLLHFISHGINSAFLKMFSSVGMAAVLYFTFSNESALPFPHPAILWLFIFLHAMAEQLGNTFLSHWFQNPTVGGMMAIVKTVVQFLVPARLVFKQVLSRIPNVLFGFVATQWCFANGLYSYLQYNLYEEGLDWFDFPIIVDTDTYIFIPLQTCCMIFVYTGVIYIVLSVYIQNVFTRKNSPGMGWLYFMRKWLNPKPENTKPSLPLSYEDFPGVFEKSSSDLICTIRLRNLCLTLDTEKDYEVSLDNINLDFNEGEITAIVGKSGSGKTDLLNMICGLLEPTSGHIEIKNLKLSDNTDFLNQFISICPQHSMLFDRLSVEDHVRLACMLHGTSYRKAKIQSKMLLQLFDLSGCKRHGYLHLSETHKKKIALSMALASSPTILILDEPCQGMDEVTAKQFWRYLQLLKAKRTIIVATSRMQDVDLYCDRMTLLAKGKALCYASPGRVKRAYNIGSTLNLKEGGQEINIELVDRIVHSEVKGAIRLSTLGYEPLQNNYRYMLPYGGAYAALLEKLEDKIKILKYSKIWISRVELSSIYYKISLSKGLESVYAAKETFFKHDASQTQDFIGVSIENDVPILEDIELIPSQKTSFSALFQRKYKYLLQKNHFVLSDFIVPSILMIFAVAYSRDFLRFKPESLSLQLHINIYQNISTFLRPVSSTIYNDIWYNAFVKAIGGSPTKRLQIHESILDEISKRQNHSLSNFKQQSIIALERDVLTTIGYYSANAFHSSPIALNAMANSFLSVISGDEYQISVYNHPFLKYEGYSGGSTQGNSTTMLAFLISIILALVAGAELQLPLLEKNKVKNLILMSGVYPSIYWITNALGDFLINAAMSTILILITLINDYFEKIFNFIDTAVLALIMFGYLCWASIPFAYIISYILKTKHNGFNHFLILHFSLGIIPKVFTYQILRNEHDGIWSFIRYFFLIFPPYSVTSALVNYFHTVTDRKYCGLYYNDNPLCETYRNLKSGNVLVKTTREAFQDTINFDPKFRSCCEDYCKSRGSCHEDTNFFPKYSPVPVLRADIISMGLQGVFYWIILCLIERKVPQKCFNKFMFSLCGNKELKAAEDDVREVDEPEDVKNEHNKVDYMIEIEDTVDTEVFLVQNVSKFYGNVKCIDHTYFTTPVKETTGILGIAKSGLTTMIKLLTTQLSPSSGSIYINNELMTEKNKLNHSIQIGYLPQENAFFPELTGNQCLYIMGKIKGIPAHQIDLQVHQWIEIFGICLQQELQTEAAVRCKNYRPGALRRLCCAMAMIGQPKIIVFDQPTLKMDINERHVFWKAIKIAKTMGKTIVFTSTTTEEIQRCANKVLLLDQGSIVAIGGVQDVIKTKARGLILSIRCRFQAFKKLDAYQIGAKIDQLRDHVIRHLSPCELNHDDGIILVYHLKDITAKLSYTYGIMEGARQKFPNLIDNFLVTEPSLDEIVLNFHKNNQANTAKVSDLHLEDGSNEKIFDPKKKSKSI